MCARKNLAPFFLGLKMLHSLLLIITFFYTGTNLFADIIWSAPNVISTPMIDAEDPRIVIDPAGNSTAAWVENGVIMASSKPAGDSWTSPVVLSDAFNTASKPKLGVDADGNVTALWLESSVIKIKTLPFGGTWDPTSTIISNSGASNPVLAVDAANNAVAMWVRSGFIESSTRISGIWNTFTVLSSGNSNNPHVAISNSGKAMAAWRSIISGAYLIMTDELTLATNTWAPVKSVFAISPAFVKDFPKVAIDNNGNATVGWFQYQFLNGNAYKNVQVMTSSLTAGATAWPMPTALSLAGIRNPADLTLKLRADTKGNILAVWTNSYDGETFFVESALKANGTPWPLYVLTQAPSLYSFGIDLASTPETTLLTSMAWDGNSAIYIQSLESDTANPVLQSWTRTNPFSMADGNANPQCAMSVQGTEFAAVAVWVSFDGQNSVISASTGSGSEIAPPTNLFVVQNTNDFGAYKDYANTITWDASLDPDVVQYNIFRNGIYFADTVTEIHQFIDHNAKENGTVTYGVAAMLSSGRQSSIISFTLNP